jgi:hypothetical protein
MLSQLLPTKCKKMQKYDMGVHLKFLFPMIFDTVTVGADTIRPLDVRPADFRAAEARQSQAGFR